MLVRKIKYKNGREIYRRTSFLDKVKYYEDLIYSIIVAFGLVAVLVFILVGFIKFQESQNEKNQYKRSRENT